MLDNFRIFIENFFNFVVSFNLQLFLEQIYSFFTFILTMVVIIFMLFLIISSKVLSKLMSIAKKVLEDLIIIVKDTMESTIRLIKSTHLFGDIIIAMLLGRMKRNHLIKVLYICIFVFSVTSFYTTYEGLLSNGLSTWIATFISIGVQLLLFVTTFLLPKYVVYRKNRTKVVILSIILVLSLLVSSSHSYTFLTNKFKERTKDLDYLYESQYRYNSAKIDIQKNILNTNNTVTEYISLILERINMHITSSEFIESYSEYNQRITATKNNLEDKELESSDLNSDRKNFQDKKDSTQKQIDEYVDKQANTIYPEKRIELGKLIESLKIDIGKIDEEILNVDKKINKLQSDIINKNDELSNLTILNNSISLDDYKNTKDQALANLKTLTSWNNHGALKTAFDMNVLNELFNKITYIEQYSKTQDDKQYNGNDLKIYIEYKDRLHNYDELIKKDMVVDESLPELEKARIISSKIIELVDSYPEGDFIEKPSYLENVSKINLYEKNKYLKRALSFDRKISGKLSSFEEGFAFLFSIYSFSANLALFFALLIDILILFVSIVMELLIRHNNNKEPAILIDNAIDSINGILTFDKFINLIEYSKVHLATVIQINSISRNLAYKKLILLFYVLSDSGLVEVKDDFFILSRELAKAVFDESNNSDDIIKTSLSELTET